MKHYHIHDIKQTENATSLEVVVQENAKEKVISRSVEELIKEVSKEVAKDFVTLTYNLDNEELIHFLENQPKRLYIIRMVYDGNPSVFALELKCNDGLIELTDDMLGTFGSYDSAFRYIADLEGEEY